ncbi:MAG: HRDC domain-containing protein, partial [Micromonosporaceae bacterium]|nr:HRDC domain-containing protein [Micromonosporaceae bacterium]
VEGEYSTLVLTDASTAVLRQQRQVMLRRDPERPAAAARASRAGSATSTSGAASTGTAGTGAGTGAGAPVPAAADLSEEAMAVFERLRAWRAETAREQGVPAYVVFHDATLRQIATEVPATMDALSTISGVGERKLARYGQQILNTLSEGEKRSSS